MRDLGTRLRLETLKPQSWVPGHLCHAELGPWEWCDLSLFSPVPMKQGEVRICGNAKENLGMDMGWHRLRGSCMAEWHREESGRARLEGQEKSLGLLLSPAPIYTPQPASAGTMVASALGDCLLLHCTQEATRAQGRMTLGSHSHSSDRARDLNQSFRMPRSHYRPNSNYSLQPQPRSACKVRTPIPQGPPLKAKHGGAFYITPALRRLRQEDCLETSIGHITKPSLTES